MIQLGKSYIIEPKVEVGTRILFGTHKYHVCFTQGRGYYMTGENCSNRQMFIDLGNDDPYKWCSLRGIVTNGTTGTFPYMEMNQLENTIKMLVAEYISKGKPVQLLGNKYTYLKF